MKSSSEKNIATFTHLSTLSQYIIPLGNYIFPIIIWTSKKEDSEYIDHHGKQALNFQLSVLIYTIALAAIALPILIYTVLNNLDVQDVHHGPEFLFNTIAIQENIGLIITLILAVLIFIGIKVAEFFLIIVAALKASNGEEYKYPFTIPFLK